MANAKRLPFEVDRDCPVSLTEQVAQGLSRAIRSGRYAPGDHVPAILDVAKELGISAMVVRNAVKRLVGAGLVTARPGSGIVVRGAEAPLWRAHVLQFSWTSNTSFYFAARQRVFCDRLHAEKVRLSVLLISESEIARGLPGLRSVAEADPPDLLVVEGESARMVRILARERIPFVQVLASRPAPQAAGSIVADEEASMRQLVRHCAACGAKRVLGVFMHRGQASADFERAIRETGMVPTAIPAEGTGHFPNPEDAEHGGLGAVRTYLRKTTSLPDLIYFADDYLGRGGLMALAVAGVRVPEDVQIITKANCGNRIAYPKELTRIEVDPEQAGDAMAKLALAVLDKSRARRHVVLRGARLVQGATTLRRRAKR